MVDILVLLSEMGLTSFNFTFAFNTPHGIDDLYRTIRYNLVIPVI